MDQTVLASIVLVCLTLFLLGAGVWVALSLMVVGMVVMALFTSAPKHADHLYVKAGVLDDSSVVQPTHQNWTASAVPWRNIARDLRSHRHGPESHAAR